MKNLLPLLSLLLISACSSSIDPVEPPAELTTIVTPELTAYHQWGHEIGKGSGRQYLKLSPLVDGERLFVANQSGRVEAYATADGKRLWRVELGGAVNAGPGDGKELLLFGGDAEVIAVSKADGAVRWRSTVSSEVLSIPAEADGIVIVHSVDGNITALRLEDGERLWQHRESVPILSLRGTGDPLLLAGGVFVGTASGKVIALDLASGKLVWESVIAEPRGRTELDRMVDVDAELVSSDGVLYASSFQGTLVAVALATGRLIWTRDIGSASGIALDTQYLYTTDTEGNVWALSRSNGGTMWRQDALLHRALSAPVQQGNYLVIGDYDGYLHWLNKSDGNVVARSRIQNFAEYWPLEGESDIYPYYHKEDRAVLLPPAIDGVQVFGMDKRGVLDVFNVAPVASGKE